MKRKDKVKNLKVLANLKYEYCLARFADLNLVERELMKSQSDCLEAIREAETALISTQSVWSRQTVKAGAVQKMAAVSQQLAENAVQKEKMRANLGTAFGQNRVCDTLYFRETSKRPAD